MEYELGAPADGESLGVFVDVSSTFSLASLAMRPEL